MTENIAIEIHNVYKEINNITILNDINISFEKANIHGIIGKNGSGKSMLFKIICGLIDRTKGDIIVSGKCLQNGEFPQKTGVIIENPGFLPNYTGFKNLKILSSINNVVSDEQIKKSISLVGLDPDDKRPVKKYSLGMRQKLGIAQAIMENPTILILDEPMNGLDSESIKLIRTLLLDLKKQQVTILLSSHNNDDINVLCDYVYEMKDGKLTCIDKSTF